MAIALIYPIPMLPLDQCAALGRQGPLGITGNGMCILALGRGFAELDLPDGPLTTCMDLPAAEGKAESKAPLPAPAAPPPAAADPAAPPPPGAAARP